MIEYTAYWAEDDCILRVDRYVYDLDSLGSRNLSEYEQGVLYADVQFEDDLDAALDANGWQPRDGFYYDWSWQDEHLACPVEPEDPVTKEQRQIWCT